MGKWQIHKESSHTREQPALSKGCEEQTRQSNKDKREKDPQKKHLLGAISKAIHWRA